MDMTPRGDLSRLYTSPVKPHKLAHVVIRTPRFKESLAWWKNILDATPTYENEQVSFITYDDEHHRIGIINMPHLADRDPKQAGLEHISFSFDDLGALLATYKRLKASGIMPFWTINHGPTISIYYYDPDRNSVELEYEVFQDKQALAAFFRSSAYQENFMGILFEPEKMIEDYEAGVPLEDLVKRPPLPPGMRPWDMHRT